MRLTYRQEQNTVIIDVIGSVIRLDGHHLFQSFSAWARECPEGTDFILNFQNATVIDSISMHSLLALRKSAHQPSHAAGSVALVVNPMIRKLLDIVRILPLFQWYDSVEEAHSSFLAERGERASEPSAAIFGKIADSVPLSVLERMSATVS
ncbi:MAG: STAS domain-containing protein [Candidatus Poribacteria bacterium]|nr:STAS domain-containing protein [Candidatus Poribacteria bacterium]